MTLQPVEFDIPEFLSRIRGNKPPYICPADACRRKSFKTFNAMQQHMDCHREPDPIDISCTIIGSFSTSPIQYIKREKGYGKFPSMRFLDSQKSVVFNLTSDKPTNIRCGIHVPLHLCAGSSPNSSQNLHDSRISVQSRGKRKTKHHATKQNGILSRSEFLNPGETTLTMIKQEQSRSIINVPQPQFEEYLDFEYLRKPPTTKKGAYLRFIEHSEEELSLMVEYDLDEEDLFWLEKINAGRIAKGWDQVKQAQLEWVLDRFEKNAIFKTTGEHETHLSSAVALNNSEEEDAVCAVCQDGNCENINAILFCDVCNLAVHQDCYGVPYIPEGSWVCRKCLHSPSEPVSCCLCPNTGGAFKKTSDDRWAHVICGLWIPEVMFANLTFLEPLEDIDKISPQRWTLRCFICKQKNVGACIQCHKTNCYKAFHVTCAQQAGLYMKIEQSNDPNDSGIRKLAYCDLHCPPSHFRGGANKGMYVHSDDEDNVQSLADEETVKRTTIKNARKVLAERRNSKPVVCVPIVPKSKTDAIFAKMEGPKTGKKEFFRDVYVFWKLKREFRRGVPLLKRLQAASSTRGTTTLTEAAAAILCDGEATCQKLIQLQRLRQDLERSRLLCELVRKRERTKLELVMNARAQLMARVSLSLRSLSLLIDRLEAHDSRGFFGSPVSTDIAPDYYTVILKPMDFSTMRRKCADKEYLCVADVRRDFDQMVKNCCEYNAKETVYYKSAVALANQCASVFAEAEKNESFDIFDWNEVDDISQEEPNKVKLSVGAAVASDGQKDGSNAAVAMAAEEQPAKKRRVRCPGTPPSSPPPTQRPRRSCVPQPLQVVPIEEKEDQTTQQQQPTATPIKSVANVSATLRLPHSPDRARPAFTMYRSKTVVKEDEDDEEESDEESEIEEDSEDTQDTVAAAGGNSLAPDTGTKVTVDAAASSESGEIRSLRKRSLETPKATPVTRRRSPASSNVALISATATDSTSAHAPKSSRTKSPPSSAPASCTAPGIIKLVSLKNAAKRRNSSSKKRRGSRGNVSGQATQNDETSAEPRVFGVVEGADISSQDASRLEAGKFEHLDLVWAKCRGSPWYPALVIDPAAPPEAFNKNGVPIPVPPEAVLTLISSTSSVAEVVQHTPPPSRGGAESTASMSAVSPESNATPLPSPAAPTTPTSGAPPFLVLFFDGKRTWQWLPKEKLLPLALNSKIDEEKLHEGKRSKMKQSVVKAYARAIEHHCMVNGCPYPFGDGETGGVAVDKR